MIDVYARVRNEISNDHPIRTQNRFHFGPNWEVASLFSWKSVDLPLMPWPLILLDFRHYLQRPLPSNYAREVPNLAPHIKSCVIFYDSSYLIFSFCLIDLLVELRNLFLQLADSSVFGCIVGNIDNLDTESVRWHQKP